MAAVSGAIALASTYTPANPVPATARAVSSAACGGHSDTITSTSPASAPTVFDVAQAGLPRPRRGLGRPPSETHATSWPAPTSTAPTAAPMSPGCSSPIAVTTPLYAARVARIFVTRALPGPALDRLRDAGHELDVWPGRTPPPRDELIAHARKADALLTLITDRVDGELLDACPSVRAVANYGVGVDNIDVAACAQRGIPVGNTPDVLTAATADLTFALILAAARRLPEAIAAVRDGDWPTWEPQAHLGLELDGAALGIVGLGRIGRAVAQRAEGFGMEVVFSGSSKADAPAGAARRRRRRLAALPTDAADPPPDRRAALAAMKPTAILVNTARGPIVDQVALRAALIDGQIAAAALDVTDPEPLPPDDPLLDAPNLIVAPPHRLGHDPRPRAHGRPRGRQPRGRPRRAPDAAPRLRVTSRYKGSDPS